MRNLVVHRAAMLRVRMADHGDAFDRPYRPGIRESLRVRRPGRAIDIFCDFGSLFTIVSNRLDIFRDFGNLFVIVANRLA